MAAVVSVCDSAQDAGVGNFQQVIDAHYARECILVRLDDSHLRAYFSTMAAATEARHPKAVTITTQTLPLNVGARHRMIEIPHRQAIWKAMGQ